MSFDLVNIYYTMGVLKLTDLMNIRFHIKQIFTNIPKTMVYIVSFN